jgi:hypothetical protein
LRAHQPAKIDCLCHLSVLPVLVYRATGPATSCPAPNARQTRGGVRVPTRARHGRSCRPDDARVTSNTARRPAAPAQRSECSDALAARASGR